MSSKGPFQPNPVTRLSQRGWDFLCQRAVRTRPLTWRFVSPSRAPAVTLNLPGAGEAAPGAIALPGQGPKEEPLALPAPAAIQVSGTNTGTGWRQFGALVSIVTPSEVMAEPGGYKPPRVFTIRSPRRHRSSSSSPPRLKERRDEDKKEIKDSKGKERQITGEGRFSSPSSSWVPHPLKKPSNSPKPSNKPPNPPKNPQPPKTPNLSKTLP